MSIYVLATDTTTLLLRGQSRVCERVARVQAGMLSVTIITVEEILTGWYTQIRRAKKDEQVLRAYQALQQAVEFLARVRVLPFTREAMEQFPEFRAAKYRVGVNDVKIAAIVQSHEATLVTCNLRDFKRLPGMHLDDWS